MIHRRRDLRRLLSALALFVLAYIWFVCTPWGQPADNWLWAQLTGFDRGLQSDISWFVRRPLVLIAAAVALGYAAVARRFDVLVTLLLAWPVAVGGAYLLREVLPRPYLGDHGGFPTNSYPSTHVALVVTPLVVVILLRGRRDLFAGLCGVGIAVCMFGNLMLLAPCERHDRVGCTGCLRSLCAPGLCVANLFGTQRDDSYLSRS